ncbi:MAG: sulfite exporter TauE/SafE family protein [Paracoccaceae bacterium]
MEHIFAILTPFQFSVACGVAALAGLIKGTVGFGMPMILVSGLSMFLAPDFALAGLLFATLASNGLQAFRQGFAAAWASVVKFRGFLIIGFLFLISTAQLVPYLSQSMFLLALGIPVSIFAALQLFGVQFPLKRQTPQSEAGFGAIAGAIGGVSGVWGPPTVLYLTALGTPKADQVRVQGVVYGLGAVALVGAHFGSGVLRAETWQLSAALVAPAIFGMWLGLRIQDRIDQATFRKVTLIVLTVAGLNLVRRGLFG